MSGGDFRIKDEPSRMMDPDEFLADSTVTVSPERYAVVRTDREYPTAFATVRDQNETTVVVPEDNYDAADGEDAERGWRILTFEVVLPFELFGFLARVATALADAEVSVFALSAFSTDHVLVKDDDVDRAVRALAELGCDVKR
nr:ACT domain-containing protein [Halomicroarcula marina]